MNKHVSEELFLRLISGADERPDESVLLETARYCVNAGQIFERTRRDKEEERY